MSDTLKTRKVDLIFYTDWNDFVKKVYGVPDDLIIATLWEVKEAIDKDMKVYMGQKPYWARIPEDERHWYMADPYDFLGTTDWEILSKLDEEEMKKEVEVHALI